MCVGVLIRGENRVNMIKNVYDSICKNSDYVEKIRGQLGGITYRLTSAQFLSAGIFGNVARDAETYIHTYKHYPMWRSQVSRLVGGMGDA